MKKSIVDLSCFDKQTQKFIEPILGVLEERGFNQPQYAVQIHMLAFNIDTYLRALKEMKDNTITELASNGTQKTNPCLNIATNAISQAKSILMEFGLTPKSEKNVKIQEKDNSGLSKFLETCK